jgi:hypothetical protein
VHDFAIKHPGSDEHGKSRLGECKCDTSGIDIGGHWRLLILTPKNACFTPDRPSQVSTVLCREISGFDAKCHISIDERTQYCVKTQAGVAMACEDQ